jgi:hypothetical protein
MSTVSATTVVSTENSLQQSQSTPATVTIPSTELMSTTEPSTWPCLQDVVFAIDVNDAMISIANIATVLE